METNQKKQCENNMALPIKKLKFLGLLILPSVLIVGPYLGYEYYVKGNKDAEELSYATSKKWQWYDEYKRIQIASNEQEDEKKSLLRKVYMDKKYSILPKNRCLPLP